MGDLGMGSMTTTTQARPHASMQRPRPPAPGETLVPRGFEQVGWAASFALCLTVSTPTPPSLPTSPLATLLPMSMVMHSCPIPISTHPLHSLLLVPTGGPPSLPPPAWATPARQAPFQDEFCSF